MNSFFESADNLGEISITFINPIRITNIDISGCFCEGFSCFFLYNHEAHRHEIKRNDIGDKDSSVGIIIRECELLDNLSGRAFSHFSLRYITKLRLASQRLENIGAIIRDIDLIRPIFGTEYYCHQLLLSEQERWIYKYRRLSRCSHLCRFVQIHIGREEYLLPNLKTYTILPNLESGDFKFTSPVLDGNNDIRKESNSFVVIAEDESVSRETSRKWFSVFCDRNTRSIGLPYFYIIARYSETHREGASFEKFICFLLQYLFASLDGALLNFWCCLGFLLQIFYRSEFPITLEEGNRINRIRREIISTKSLINNGHRIFAFCTSHIIIWMSLIGCINLKMEMIPIGISRIPNFSYCRSHFNRSPSGSNFGKMGVIGINIRPISEAMFDGDSISPSILPRSRNDFPISNRADRCPLRCRDINPLVTPESDIPTVCIGRTIEYRIDTSVRCICFVLGIICLLDPRHRHLTISPEHPPHRKPTRRLRDHIKRVHETPRRDNLGREEENCECKKKFFHENFEFNSLKSGDVYASLPVPHFLQYAPQSFSRH